MQKYYIYFIHLYLFIHLFAFGHTVYIANDDVTLVDSNPAEIDWAAVLADNPGTKLIIFQRKLIVSAQNRPHI